MLLEVPGASLVAWAWLGQVPPLAVLPGTVLVLAGLVAGAAREGPRRQPQLVSPPPDLPPAG